LRKVESDNNNTPVNDDASYVEYKKITPEEAYRIMDESTDYILLDVRTDGEFKAMWIEGAILILDNELGNRAETELPV
jgi:rhodanese-related sulfurtransferase